jgi:hypothetical protein
MTTPHRTLQMALDALDRAISDDRAYIRECKDAAEAIRAHLAAQPAPAEDFCYCDDDISLQMVSGGAAPEGLYGRVTLKIGDAYVNYVKAQPAAPVPDALAEAVAKAIYWEWRRDAGYVPWVDGGNSLKQDDARKIARAVVSSAAPVVREPLRDDAFHAWVEEASADHPNLLERQEFRDAMYNAWINGYNTRVDEQAHGITGGSNG